MALGAGDCERLHDGLIAQPVNTASALAFVAVGAWLMGRRRPALGVAVAAVGVGSVDFHGPGSPAARLLHDGTLYLVVGFVAWHEVARRVGQAAASTPACWWLGRTTSPVCDPDSLLQPHAAWHLLAAAALAAWAVAALDPPAQARS